MKDLMPQNNVSTTSTDSRQSIYSTPFLNLTADHVAKKLQDEGFYVFEGAISPQLVDQVLQEANSFPIGGYNVNDVSPVRYFKQTFFAHCLAASPTIMKLITDSYVMQICSKYLGPKFRLKCQRYYESGMGYQLGWHTDNKTVDNKKTDVRGIVFIIYLTDTYDGELQVVKGSNNWSGESLSNDFADEELRKNHEKDILSLPGPKGTLVITDTYTVHRTRMLTTPDFRRKSLFFQVDDDLFHSEKIIINTEYLPPMSEQLMQFLGFGLPSGYKSMPQSGIHTLTNQDLYYLIGDSVKELLKRIKGLRRFAHLIKGTPQVKENVINR